MQKFWVITEIDKETGERTTYDLIEYSKFSPQAMKKQVDELNKGFSEYSTFELSTSD